MKFKDLHNQDTSLSIGIILPSPKTAEQLIFHAIDTSASAITSILELIRKSILGLSLTSEKQEEEPNFSRWNARTFYLS